MERHSSERSPIPETGRVDAGGWSSPPIGSHAWHVSLRSKDADPGTQAVLIGERITGRGVVQAVDHAVGVPLWEIEPLLGALVLALLVGAVYPRRKYASRRSQVCITMHLRLSL